MDDAIVRELREAYWAAQSDEQDRPLVAKRQTESAISKRTPIERQVTGERQVVFTVPGPAFIDGTDPLARPPLTIAEVNVWPTDKVGMGDRRFKKHPVHVLHGEQVQILRIRFSEKLHRQVCEITLSEREIRGWVLSIFLNIERVPTIGEIV